jgi:molybdopterin converting factor subunit 1
MKCDVRLFARARDLAGADTLQIELDGRCDVRQLRATLAQICPALAVMLPRCAVAVNEEFATDDVMIPADATIAILPPVSGGAGDS